MIDEYTGRAVLPRSVVVALHDLAGEPSDGEIGNAGLLHVYGYLLSAEPTPFGAKHERWTSGAVARAIGVDPSSLLPWSTTDETPLATLTGRLETMFQEPADAVLVVDEVGDGVVARTLLLTAPLGSAIAYAVGATAESLRLVTVFPIDDPAAFERRLLDAPPRIRYNAVPPSLLVGQQLTGRSITRHAVGGPT